MLEASEVQAIADEIVSRLGTLPNDLRTMVRVNTTQVMDLHYIAENPAYAPQVRFQFTDAGVRVEWMHPNGYVFAQQMLTWQRT